MTAPHASPPAALPWTDRAPEELDVAIVGGGFSGILVLIHLLRAAPTARIGLFERRWRSGPGIAYGACDAQHLLNVPAGRMGAFPDDPSGFHRWLDAARPGRHAPQEFVPRALYGEYLLGLLHEALAERTAGAGGEVSLIHGAVVHLERLPTRVELLLASGAGCVARTVILAPGLPPARAPWIAADQGVPRHLLASDPWDHRAYDGLDPASDVLVVGSGLTAVDVVLSLLRRGHRGRVIMVSRQGRLPLPHAQDPQPAVDLSQDNLLVPPKLLLRLLRSKAETLAEVGQGWQALIDALRPMTTAIWRQWSIADQRRFLRRLRPFWEIHRHRAPGEVLATLERLRQEGRLELRRGSVVALQPSEPDSLLATVRGRRGEESFRVARVFNCIGPTTSLAETRDPLLGSLLRDGLATCDPHGLGLRTDDRGWLLDARDGASDAIALVGALRRGDLWESTAVPELRVQARRVAQAVAERLAACATARVG